MDAALGAALVLLLSACGDGDDTGVGRMSDPYAHYIGAVCRFYTQGPCADAMAATCGASIEYETKDQCVTAMTLAYDAQCPALAGEMVAAADTVAACVALLDGFDCATDAVCDQSGFLLARGACEQVDLLIHATCGD